MSLVLFENGKAVGDTFIQFVKLTKKTWHTVWKHKKDQNSIFFIEAHIMHSTHR